MSEQKRAAFRDSFVGTLCNRWMQLLNLARKVIWAVNHEPTVRRALHRSKRTGTKPIDWFFDASDEAWLWLHTSRVIRKRPTVASLLPGLPAASLQEEYTGSSAPATLYEGFSAYRLFKHLYETYVGPVRDCRGILDYGCGWGRIIRFFLRELPPEKLTGVDHSQEAIQICKNTNKWGNFVLSEPYPPTPLASQSFDLIFLYSVFSHLPEEMHWMLLAEFHRLLAPGGLLIATTRARDFIQFCNSLREDPQLEQKPDWLKQSSRVFRDMHAATSAYDRGEFCYESLGRPGRWSFWGEACIPKGYVERRWPEIFEVCDYIDDRGLCPQNVIVARKRT
jgi:SAM-dependent methyltransferase